MAKLKDGYNWMTCSLYSAYIRNQMKYGLEAIHSGFNTDIQNELHNDLNPRKKEFASCNLKIFSNHTKTFSH